MNDVNSGMMRGDETSEFGTTQTGHKNTGEQNAQLLDAVFRDTGSIRGGQSSWYLRAIIVRRQEAHLLFSAD